MQEQSCCSSKLNPLLFPFSLPSPSSLLKLPGETAQRNRIFSKPLSRVEFFKSDGFGEFVWETGTGYISPLRHKLGSSLKWKLPRSIADTNVLFAFLPPLIACLTECVELNFAILTITITHLKRRLNLIQISVSRGSVKRLLLIWNSSKTILFNIGFVQRRQVPGGTTYRQAWPLSSIYVQHFKKTAKSFAHAYYLLISKSISYLLSLSLTAHAGLTDRWARGTKTWVRGC